MAYKYEVQQKANQLRVRVLIAIYILFVVSAAIIGISVRLQQIRSVQPTRPGASDALTTGYTASSDPTYSPVNIYAYAYCDVVDSNGVSTGTSIPLPDTEFFFVQNKKRDVGQIRNGATGDYASLCSGVASFQGCGLNAQTVAQCQSSRTSCPSTSGDDGIAGIVCAAGDVSRTSGSNGLVSWPQQGADNTDLGDLRWDDNEIVVQINTAKGPLSNGTVNYNGTTYTINTSLSYLQSSKLVQAATISSLLPIYRWQCQAGCLAGDNSCTVNGLTYNRSQCSFNGTSFVCPDKKVLNYAGSPFAADESDDAFLYNKVAAYRDTTTALEATRVHAGFGYAGIADSSYPNPSDLTPAGLTNFKGNMVKYRFECQAPAPTITPSITPSLTVTPSITPTGFSLSARKTGPACVERNAPNNKPPFVITVTNNGTANATIGSVDDALPVGLTFTAGSIQINGVAVGDTYATTSVTGSSQLIKFARPDADGGAWVLAPGQQLIITFVATVGGTAVSGTNTNQVVVNPVGESSIDNIRFQFEIVQTCVPVTGLLDEPIILITGAIFVIVVSMYVIYNPSGIAKALDFAGSKAKRASAKMKNATANKVTPKDQFERKVTRKISKSEENK